MSAAVTRGSLRAVRAGISAAAMAVLVLSGACSKSAERAAATDAGAGAGANADADGAALVTAKAGMSDADGKKLVAGACLSCHTEHMLAQQRLTPTQWTKTVTKMVSWGANLEPSEEGPLVRYLSRKYEPDAGAYVAETLSAAEAVAEIEPTPDGTFPAGDAERGKALFVDKCSGCHGADARGGIGVLLVDRPFLYRASDFAKTVRKGRGKMLPLSLSDAEIGDVLAHLRTLKNP